MKSPRKLDPSNPADQARMQASAKRLFADKRFDTINLDGITTRTFAGALPGDKAAMAL